MLMGIAAAGVTFEGRQVTLSSLYGEAQKGALLPAATLEREYTNRHDKNAIQIKIGGRPVGYVPRRIALDLAPQMDTGATVRVRETRIVSGTGDGGEVTYGVRLELEVVA